MMLKTWFEGLSPTMKAFAALLGAVFLYGVFLRLLPLFQGAEAIAYRFVTEDGYLLLTVSRNMAIGEGMSVSDGTIGTNGVQPLITFIFVLPFLLAGGSKIGGLVGVGIVMTAISVFGAWAVFRFAKRTLVAQTDLWVWPAVAAALWFVSQLPVGHSMNALESGLYCALAAVTFTFFGHVTNRGGQYTQRDQVILGSLCGLCFLARIDGAFLVTAIFATRFLSVQLTRQLNFKDAVIEALPPGFLSLAFAAPWLIHNQLRFGSIMPISGPAQSLNAEFAQNLPLVPAKVFEQIAVMLPVPKVLEESLLFAILLLLTIAAVMGVFYWLQFKNKSPMRYAVVAYGLFGLALMGYYGLFFGAPHFLARYTFPLSPLGITAMVSVVLWVASLAPKLGQLMKVGFAAVSILLAIALTTDEQVITPKRHGHLHVVQWVENHVPDDTWVGAIQTGTLGFWHDRTINLDGKVNPAALDAIIEEGHVLDYVASSKIDVLADWAGIAAWPHAATPSPAFEREFDVLINDPRRNFGVQVREGTELIGGPLPKQD